MVIQDVALRKYLSDPKKKIKHLERVKKTYRRMRGKANAYDILVKSGTIKDIIPR